MTGLLNSRESWPGVRKLWITFRHLSDIAEAILDRCGHDKCKKAVKRGILAADVFSRV
jgi:hypothetical protein